MSRYNEINDSLKGLPRTWYPALLKTLVEEAVDKRTFAPGGAARFVQKVEEDAALIRNRGTIDNAHPDWVGNAENDVGRL